MLSTVHLQIIYMFLQSYGNARTKVQETQDVFYTDRPMKDFGMLSQSNKVPHISRTLYRLTVCCCLLRKSGKHPTTALE